MTRVILLIAAGLAMSWGVCAAQGQDISQTGLKPNLPLTPGLAPRPLESDDQRFGRGGRTPLGGFADAITSNDAVLEIIVGQGRVVTTKTPIAREGGIALVAAGDPTVLDFEVVGPRLIRVLGNRIGVTDLSITTDDGETYAFEVHVVYDLALLSAYLRQIYPDALIELRQLREHVVLEGQARTAEQVTQIVQTLRHVLASQQVPRQVQSGQEARPEQPAEGRPSEEPEAPEDVGGEQMPQGPTPIQVPEEPADVTGTFNAPQIINLMRVPGLQQVMLKVQVAELNRTALRQVGADMFVTGNDGIVGTSLGNSIASLFGQNLGSNTTAFGIFPSSDFSIFLSALRANSIVNVLAEPNLVAMNGQEASFLAGGEFPVPVPQGGLSNQITIQYKEFGVQLNFVPTILDDETIRLRVAPEVSSLDFSNAVGLQGTQFPIPALNTRRVSTTVELKQGQTFALAGLMQIDLNAQTNRIPGLGDLPYIGPFFSNTTHNRIEKELLLMVTPYFVSPMDECQVPPLPGSEVLDPNDKEFYLLNRIEGRTGRPFRSTTAWDDPWNLRRLMKLENSRLCGPVGYSE